MSKQRSGYNSVQANLDLVHKAKIKVQEQEEKARRFAQEEPGEGTWGLFGKNFGVFITNVKNKLSL